MKGLMNMKEYEIGDCNICGKQASNYVYVDDECLYKLKRRNFALKWTLVIQTVAILAVIVFR